MCFVFCKLKLSVCVGRQKWCLHLAGWNCVLCFIGDNDLAESHRVHKPSSHRLCHHCWQRGGLYHRGWLVSLCFKPNHREAIDFAAIVDREVGWFRYGPWLCLHCNQRSVESQMDIGIATTVDRKMGGIIDRSWRCYHCRQRVRWNHRQILTLLPL